MTADRPGYREHFQQPAAAAAYASAYQGAADSADRQAWRHQRRWLAGMLPPGRRALDYACGSGRVLAVLAARYPQAYGWDSSPAMLAACRNAVPAARLQLVDLTEPDPPAGRFDAITAFRLLLNLEAERRPLVLAGLAARLAPGGRLIVENHGNRWSLRHLALRARPRRAGFGNELSDRELRRLLTGAGLRVLARAGFGWLPDRLHRGRYAGQLAHRLDGLLLRTTRTPRLAIRVVYVAGRPG